MKRLINPNSICGRALQLMMSYKDLEFRLLHDPDVNGGHPVLLDRDLVIDHFPTAVDYLEERHPVPSLRLLEPSARATARLLLHKLMERALGTTEDRAEDLLVFTQHKFLAANRPLDVDFFLTAWTEPYPEWAAYRRRVLATLPIR